jgi:hypothetical protein
LKEASEQHILNHCIKRERRGKDTEVKIEVKVQIRVYPNRSESLDPIEHIQRMFLFFFTKQACLLVILSTNLNKKTIPKRKKEKLVQWQSKV